MTIDKIKNHVGNQIFAHWTDSVAYNKDVAHEERIQLLTDGKTLLEKELADGLLKGIQYEAELKLVNILLG